MGSGVLLEPQRAGRDPAQSPGLRAARGQGGAGRRPWGRGGRL